MSKPIDPFDLFPSSDPDGDFGRDEGLAGYLELAEHDPDRPVAYLAERAVRIQMILEGRFDVNPSPATRALINELRMGLPSLEDED